MLSDVNHAKLQPFEYQMPENLVYCDYLEHLLLHILICEKEPFGVFDENNKMFFDVGSGGIKNFIVPELNDFYSGYVSPKEYENKNFEVVKNDKDIFLELISRHFLHYWCKTLVQNQEIKVEDFNLFLNMILKPFAFHVMAGWDYSKNKKLYSEIISMIKNCIKSPTTKLGYKLNLTREYYEEKAIKILSILNANKS